MSVTVVLAQSDDDLLAARRLFVEHADYLGVGRVAGKAVNSYEGIVPTNCRIGAAELPVFYGENPCPRPLCPSRRCRRDGHSAFRLYQNLLPTPCKR